jgi:hypothetical protein
MLRQERLKTERVDAGPVEGVLNAQTAPALRPDQQHGASLFQARRIRRPLSRGRFACRPAFAVAGDAARWPSGVAWPLGQPRHQH